jgi:hypothetical protein
MENQEVAIICKKSTQLDMESAHKKPYLTWHFNLIYKLSYQRLNSPI